MAPWRIVLFRVVWRVTKWLGIVLLARTFFRSNNASPTVVAAMSSLIIPRCCTYLFDAFIRVWEEILFSKRNHELKPCASELPQIEAEIWQRIAVAIVGAISMTSLLHRDVMTTILSWYLDFFDIWWVTKILFLLWSQIRRFLRCKRKRE